MTQPKRKPKAANGAEVKSDKPTPRKHGAAKDPPPTPPVTIAAARRVRR